MLKATMLPDAMPVIRVLETWKTESGLNQFKICLFSLSLRGESVSLTSDHGTGPWLGCRHHSRGRRTAV